ncbi:MAG: glutamate-cysteine ligase family protein [Gudongella sp.]|nr:glutamate-cysteine ligase family protein [Gudongella sp.]
MDYNKKVEMIENYIRQGEKKEEYFKLGIEIEHFVLNKNTLESISYYGKDGIEQSLREMMKKGWVGQYEGDYLLGLKKNDLNITLEPGSQFEVSIDSKREIYELEKGYLEFLDELLPILENKGQVLAALGYHPLTQIDEIKLLPKKRYDIMFNYFKDKGSHAHNMMKGTGALQVAIDFSSEEDYHKKFRSLNALAPVFYALFENALFFEKEPCQTHNLRSYVWLNCDNDRAGTVEGALSDEFSYKDYAKYILERPPIFTIRDGELIETKDKKTKEILNSETTKTNEVEHLLSMFFPDVRTKKYIEIRMMDSVPYPLNFSVVALIKGLFYDEENLDVIYKFIKDIKDEDVYKAKIDMLSYGLKTPFAGKTILEIGKWLVTLAEKGLRNEEKHYLEPLKDLLEKGLNPYLYTLEEYKRGDRKKAIEWAILRREKNGFIKDK